MISTWAIPSEHHDGISQDFTARQSFTVLCSSLRSLAVLCDLCVEKLVYRLQMILVVSAQDDRAPLRMTGIRYAAAAA